MAEKLHRSTRACQREKDAEGRRNLFRFSTTPCQSSLQTESNVSPTGGTRSRLQLPVRSAESFGQLVAPVFYPWRGRQTMNVVPCSADDTTSMNPPCACTICWAMYSPRPRLP
jgi:hypothetical protein